MHILNPRQIVAIEFFGFTFLIGEFFPFVGFLFNALLYRLDKKVFWFSTLYYSGEMAYSYLKPQTFVPMVTLWNGLLHRMISPDLLAQLPSWIFIWIPITMFGIACPLAFLFGTYFEARIIDRFYLWKKLKHLFLRWGMLH